MFTNIEAAIDFIENQRANSATLEDFAKVFEKYANFQNKLDYICYLSFSATSTL